MDKLKLEQVDKELFKKVMKLVDHVGNKEEHFNNLETEYRKLASTWLLASLGACGFVLKSTAEFSFDKWYIVFGICIAAAVGISIIGMLDMRVYQKLLHCFFIEGVRLELLYSEWLPAFRINILNSQESRGVISRIQYYYLISATLLIVLATIAIWNFSIWKDEYAIKIIITLAIAAISLLFRKKIFIISKRENEKFYKSEIGKMFLEHERSLSNK